MGMGQNYTRIWTAGVPCFHKVTHSGVTQSQMSTIKTRVDEG